MLELAQSSHTMRLQLAQIHLEVVLASYYEGYQSIHKESCDRHKVNLQFRRKSLTSLRNLDVLLLPLLVVTKQRYNPR